MFRRRRRPRLIWMPTIGTEQDNVTSFSDSPSGRAFSLLGISGNSGAVRATTELTFDNPPEQSIEALGGVSGTLVNAFGMAQWELQSWRLRRIVGKMFAGCALEDVQEPAPTVAALFTAGVIVRRVHDDTGTPALSAQDREPQVLQTIRDPWIWRRQWILSSGAASSSGIQEAYGVFPRTTAGYGSVQDGPHLDQKCNRIIGPQERLFLEVSATGLPVPHNGSTGNVEVHGYFDYRLLGSLMKSSNRRNASR